MNSFETSSLNIRMQAILEAGVAQGKSVDISMRSYQGVWTVGVKGVRLCQGSSFESMLEQLEKELGLPAPIDKLAMAQGYSTRYQLIGTRWHIVLCKDAQNNYFATDEQARTFLGNLSLDATIPPEPHFAEDLKELAKRKGYTPRYLRQMFKDIWSVRLFKDGTHLDFPTQVNAQRYLEGCPDEEHPKEPIP